MEYHSLIVQAKMLKDVSRISDEFDQLDLDQVFNDIENYDFNDKYYLQLAEEKGYKILTNDKGFFRNKTVTIVSAKAW